MCSFKWTRILTKSDRAPPVTLTFDVLTQKTLGVLLIWYITHIQSLKVLCRKVFQLSQPKKVWTRQTDGAQTPEPIIELDQDSCPDKHSDEVWKFSVEKYAAQEKCGRTDGDGQTDDPYSNLTKIFPRQTFWRSLKVLCRKVFEQLSPHKESVDGQCGRTDRPQMTHIRTWPRSSPDKHSDQVWSFYVEKYSSYGSTKCGRTDWRMDTYVAIEWLTLMLSFFFVWLAA